jgi:hypothetical protein
MQNRNEYMRNYNHRTGKHVALEDSPNIGAYLGVHIAERALSKFFDNIQKMPYGNPGFDFLCGKGKKIDVKSGCLRLRGRSSYWIFDINRNTIADYFLVLAFNNRKNLEPQHVWLIPGKVINDHKTITITNTKKLLDKWDRYERALTQVLYCCKKIKLQDRYYNNQ